MEYNEEELNEETIQRFENMLKTNKTLFFDSEEFEDLILYYLDSGKINLSKKALKLALDQHPNSLGIKVVQAELYIFEDKLDQAMKLLDEVERLDADNEEVYFQKSSIYSKKGDHKNAIQMLEKAFHLAEDTSEVFMLIGLEYLYLEDFNQALMFFERCLQQNPADHAAILNVMYCYDIMEKTLEAIAFLEKFIDNNPYNELAWQQLGKQYYKTKDYENAVNAFDMAIVIDEFFSGAYVEKGKSLEKCKRYEEAIRNYHELLKIEESSAFVYARMGYCYDKLDQTKQSLYYYLKAVQEDPLYERSWIYITDLYIRFNKFDKALHFINKALGIDEQNYTYWRRFAIINKELKYWEEAELGFRKAIDYGDDFFDTWLYWIDVLVELKENKLALAKVKKCLTDHPKSAALMYRAVGIYFLSDEPINAMIYLKKALDLSPEESDIIKYLYPDLKQLDFINEFVNHYKL